MGAVSQIFKPIILIPIRLYRYFISPVLGAHCRFTPSCSSYAEQAVDKYGVLYGGWLALKRLSRCHPFSAGGFDPLVKPISLVNDEKTV